MTYYKEYFNKLKIKENVMKGIICVDGLFGCWKVVFR